jgi:hypothetical protein
MLRILKKKERRRILRPINSIRGDIIQDNTLDDDDLAQEAIQYYHLAPNIASLLDTIRSGLGSLLGATPFITTPRMPTYSKTSTSITIEWQHPTNSHSGGLVDFTTQLTLTSGQTVNYIDCYELRYRLSGTVPWTNVTNITSTTNTIPANQYASYNVEIRGINFAIGPSDWITLSIPGDLI